GAIVNSSCEDLQLPPELPKRYYINSFVHTRSQIQAFFPSCSKSYMKEVTSKFDIERLGKENSTNLLQFSVRNDVIVAYRSITDQFYNRLAVMDCLLITRSGFVLASSTTRTPGPLARFDPQLFASLVENNLVTTHSWVDAQAECMASRSAPWSSPATRRSNIFRTIIDTISTLIGKTFWIDLYYLLTSFVAGQPSMSGGICRFQRIKPVERCFLRHTSYKMTLNISKQIQLSDMKCARSVIHFSRLSVTTILCVLYYAQGVPGASYNTNSNYEWIVPVQAIEPRRNTLCSRKYEPTPECLLGDSAGDTESSIAFIFPFICAVLSSL
ncbi:hypothetical protein OSTOST_21582, partial [Ostertagia ostertagi]